MSSVKFQYFGEETIPNLAGVGEVKPNQIITVTAIQAEGLRKHGGDQFRELTAEEVAALQTKAPAPVKTATAVVEAPVVEAPITEAPKPAPVSEAPKSVEKAPAKAEKAPAK